MKIIINRVALQNAIAAASPAAVSRIKPVLQCVRIAADGEKVSVAATDLEISIVVETSLVQVESSGVVLVPADKIRDIVRETSDETLALETVGETLSVKGSDSRFKVYTFPALDFPPVPDRPEKASYTVTAGQLKRGIRQALVAIDNKPTRPTYGGALASIVSGRLAMAGTDGRRMSLSYVNVNDADKDAAAVIIPTRALSAIDKLLTDAGELIEVAVTDNRATFSTSDWVLTTNVIEGQFPSYAEVIPKECDRKITAGTADLLSAVRRSALLTTPDSKGVRFSFSASGLVMTGSSPSSGEATIDFACKFEGANLDIGFNPAFFNDGLKAAETDEITFEMLAPNRPGLMKAGRDFTYVVMPVNLQ